MNTKCEIVIFSDKAYNAIIRESFAKHPVETGGILLGYILDNGIWVVMEMIPPGINGVFKTAYFEYDQEFVNYLGTSVANQYKEPLQVLGLWHRHPGSMDYFSLTDDSTNSEFASKNPYGVISGIVNIDPSFRLTMYHLNHNSEIRPPNIAYSTVDVEVGDDLIPKKFFALRYVDEQRSELHPMPNNVNTQVSPTPNVPKTRNNRSGDEISEMTTSEVDEQPSPSTNSKVKSATKFNFHKLLLPTIAFFILLVGVFIGVTVAPLLVSTNGVKQEEKKLFDVKSVNNPIVDRSQNIDGQNIDGQNNDGQNIDGQNNDGQNNDGKDTNNVEIQNAQH